MAGNSTSALGSAIEERGSGAGSSRPRAVGCRRGSRRVMRKSLVLALLYSACAMAAPPKLLPMPSHVVERAGSFTLSRSVIVGVPLHDRGAAEAASQLGELL